MSSLALFEFVRYDNLDEIIYENFFLRGLTPEDARYNARVDDIQAREDEKALEPIKKQLADFITNELSNIKMSPETLSLEDLVKKNQNNFTSTISHPDLKPLFWKLCTAVNKWLSVQPNQQQIQKLLEPSAGKITDLISKVAPLVSENLKA